MFQFLPHSVLQMGTIFLSIVIEALPFVMLGCVISGALHVFLTPERVKRILPKNKFLSIIVGSFLGFFFPSCECGIVPIVHQFVKKDVPTYTAFAFMITAPIINPIVLFSTYIAFGNSVKFVIWRVLGSMLVALVVGVWLAYINKTPILQQSAFDNTCVLEEEEHPHEKETFWHKCWSVLTHGIDEFFDTGRYLIFGSLLAAAMQTYLPTGAMLQLGHTKLLAILVMLILAATLSLCSEADAFIGSSLLSLFGNGPVVGFLVFGPMVDIKNLLMMKRYFKTSFMLKFVGIVTVVVSLYALAI
ncbi:permease [Enterococcus moraviensis ATCC BAA-383]|uniref:Permease n=1 Tax=Enterococcus moraviensis ATCC BAA-383 TaxID=1158609 RepID=R2QZ53_9ENTE|nr:permease [Enterococcus moraviensis]EOI01835.1 permease [Enterococcus moraviensis ATCC BAA-383]EOT73630.1 permease [Enterococcus moraviensis ATCC BAA-383]OJG69190.1 permease [Enterococcus moraviensis]